MYKTCRCPNCSDGMLLWVESYNEAQCGNCGIRLPKENFDKVYARELKKLSEIKEEQ